MSHQIKSKNTLRFMLAAIIILLIINILLGYLLTSQSRSSIITITQERMLDLSNTAASMVNGDVLESVTLDDRGTDDYEAIISTLTSFQDHTSLDNIYCIRDMGDGTFTLGLSPKTEDSIEYGSPLITTDALFKASNGTAAADKTPHKDARGSFYSAYSPVFDSQGKIAGIIGVDFSAAWYHQQFALMTRKTIVVAFLSFLISIITLIIIIARHEQKIDSIHGQLLRMASTLMQEMGNAPLTEGNEKAPLKQNKTAFPMDNLEKQIHAMQSELQERIAQVNVQAKKDGLTGVKSRHAYLEMEKNLDDQLRDGTVSEFAIVVCDINGLKIINDTQGHQAGDRYICSSCKMICDIFSHSPVYRIGGDEFAALLMGSDYRNQQSLLLQLHSLSASHIGTDKAIVSGGLASYEPGEDHCVRDVFERADAEMYKEKTLLKSLGAATREDETDKNGRATEEIPILNIRRHILIADDQETNREIMGALLSDDYGILYACDGVETMEMLRKHKDEIALLLLDLYMPNMTGKEVIREMQVDEDLMSIPVIMLTVDHDAELDSLRNGAMDFISKPYPDINIVKARISKCIELSENRYLIKHTQRDRLTGLLHFDYFLQYVDRFEHQHKESAFDVFVCDINQFRSINIQYGRQFGDLVLRSIGINFRKLARTTGGIGCRKGADTFILYCPHQNNYEELIRSFYKDLFMEKDTANKITLRFGAFVNAEQEPDIEKRFSLAKSAADSIENDSTKICGFVDFPA